MPIKIIFLLIVTHYIAFQVGMTLACWYIRKMEEKSKLILGFLIDKLSPRMKEMKFPEKAVVYDRAIERQGEVVLGLNRENLAKRLYIRYERHKINHIWEEITNQFTKDVWLAEADALIAHEGELLEVKKINPKKCTCQVDNPILCPIHGSDG